MVDPDRVRQVLDLIAGHRAQLLELARLPAEQYAGRDAIAGRYLVQVTAQACVDVANHVIASSGWRERGGRRVSRVRPGAALEKARASARPPARAAPS